MIYTKSMFTISALLMCAAYGVKDYMAPSDLFAAIARHEIIKVNVENAESSIASLKFSAFGNDFDIELQRNDDLVESNIHFTEGVSPGHILKTNSCHFYAQPLGSTGYGAFSTCRGLRGFVVVGDEKYFIKPSAHFFEQSKSTHTLSDDYIVYRESDMDIEDDEPMMDGMKMFEPTEEMKELREQVQRKVDAQRRRRLYNDGHTYVQVKVMAGPNVVEYCRYQALNQNMDWHEFCVELLVDTMNGVHSLYWNNANQGWGSSGITKVSVKLVAITFVPAFTGTFASMEPSTSHTYVGWVNNVYGTYTVSDYTYSNCQDYKDYCQLEQSYWFYLVTQWIHNNAEIGTEYDNVVFLHRQNIGNWGGLAGVGSMCSSSGGRSSSTNSLKYPDGAYKIIAHEMGHNFGASHKACPDTDGVCPVDSEGGFCGENDGIMGYGNSKPDHFSECSLSRFKQYFESSGGFTCLSVRSSVSTPNTNLLDIRNMLPDLTPSPVADTSGCTATFKDCVKVSNLNVLSTDWNGEYDIHSCDDYGYPAYFKVIGSTTWYLSRYNSQKRWQISQTIGSSSINAYCDTRGGESPIGCSDWQIWSSSTWNDGGDVSITDSCSDSSSSSGNDDNGPFPTKEPTKRPTPQPTGKPLITACTTCVEIEDLSTNHYDMDWNGVWEAEECDSNNYPIYSKTIGGGTQYLYRYAEYSRWQIGNTVGSPNLFTYCNDGKPEDVADCGTWTTWQGDSNWVDDSTVSVTDDSCSSSGNTGSSSSSSAVACESQTSLECLSITGFDTSLVSSQYSGQWTPEGSCYEGYPVYTITSGGATSYLWRASGWWRMGSSIGGSTLVFALGSGDAPATFYRLYKLVNGAWSTTTPTAADCSESGALTSFGDECLDDVTYGSSYCFYSNGTLWNGHADFAKSDSKCSNGHPVFEWFNGDEAEQNEVGGILSMHQYHLSFDSVYYRYSDDLLPTKRWIVTTALADIPLLSCEEESLLDCTQSKWITAGYGYDDEIDEEQNDQYMVVHGDSCEVVLNGDLVTNDDDDDDDEIVDGVTVDGEEQNNDSDEDEEDGEDIIILAVCLGVLAVLIVVGVVLYRRSKSQGVGRGKASFKKTGADDIEMDGTKTTTTQFQ